ncbi:MAG: flavodoxin family protein [Methyloceanibacter sp.]|uniref:flavodoxin family protein n=1 Tax=Methyloceanibacter sp. TaxID=1965321 RepID=UPI003D6D5EE0
MKALVLSSSPRRNGNSAALAEAAAAGLREAGHACDLVFVDDVVKSFLRDCRNCRKEDGACAIDDGFARAFLGQFLPADGFIAATPVYWYGMSAQLKAFLDRMFCYVAASYPRSPDVVRGLMGKRIGLVVSSEETFPTVSAGIVHQIQEYCRYTHSTFAGVVHGIGNARCDVAKDPSQPLVRARRLGRDLFSSHATDYAIDTERSARVWG